MTELYLKDQLQMFRVLQEQVKVWEYCFLYDKNENIKCEYDKQVLQIHIIEHSMTVLNEKEKFVIEKHLIYKRTWDEISVLFDEKWGIMSGRSIRTMKRMQRKALQKMMDFLTESGLERYFN